MPNEQDFDFFPPTRDDLIYQVKQKSFNAGFRAIIPFADRNNRFQHSTSFACCLGGMSSIRKSTTNCPFKATYVRLMNENFYRLSRSENSFLMHNHPLPINESSSAKSSLQKLNPQTIEE
jgi:hypothetical protein